MIYINAAIGAGKTSLTELLVKDLGTKGYYEKVDNMPMLTKFYSAGKDSRYQLAFALQCAFLNLRYQQLREGLYLAEEKGQRNLVYDSSLLSDGLMAKNLFKRGEFPKEEYNLYLELAQNMQANVSGHPFSGFPNLVVYLDIPFDLMLQHITGRARAMEVTDPSLIDYYKSVWKTYRHWADSYSQSAMVTIDMSKYDFVNDLADREAVLDLIEHKLIEIGQLTQADYDKIISNRKQTLVTNN